MDLTVNPFVILVVGVPRSGKTYIAQTICDQIRGGIMLTCSPAKFIRDLQNGAYSPYKYVILEGCWILEDARIRLLADYIICASRPDRELRLLRSIIREMDQLEQVNYGIFVAESKKILALFTQNKESADFVIRSGELYITLGKVDTIVFHLKHLIK